MIEEPDDEVGITRREKSAKPKQEPIIKGVLPDQPAPVAPPKEEPVVAVAPAASLPARLSLALLCAHSMLVGAASGARGACRRLGGVHQHARHAMGVDALE